MYNGRDMMDKSPASLRLASRVLLLASLGTVGACEDPNRPGRVGALELTSPTENLDVAQAIVLSARATDPSGAPLEKARIRWESSNPAIAVVNAGEVTGRAPGEVVIRASAGGHSDSVRLTVERPLAALTVAPDSVVLLTGRPGTLFVEMADASGQPQAHSLTLSSSAPAVVAVENERTLRGIAVGTALLTVRAGLRSVGVPVRVVTGERFQVRSLGTLGGESRANALNNRGEVVGVSRVAQNGVQRPFLWRRGAMTDLGVPGGDTNAMASDVSDRGEVVGVAYRPNPDPGLLRPVYSAWRWRNGTRSLIEFPGLNFVANSNTFIYLGPLRVNDAGDVVVQYNHITHGGGTHVSASTYLVRGGTLARITVPGSPEWVDYTAGGINRRGTVAFTRWRDVSYTGSEPVAFRWKDGSHTAGPEGLNASAINDQGLVVGRCGSWPNHVGCTWDGTTRREIAGTRDAVAVNVHGDILALAADNSPVLVRGGTLVRLNDVVGTEWEILSFYDRAPWNPDINDWGQISATGKNRTTGELRALLLTPS
jgi:probable HAF family extracellular repeat protein